MPTKRLPRTHTPGPWEVRAGDVYQVGSGGPPLVSHIGNDSRTPDHCSAGTEERLATARLIAAAPDMLGALRQAADQLDAYLRGNRPPGNDLALAKIIRAAIAKAEGCEP